MLAKQQIIIIQYLHLLSPKGKILVPQNIYLFIHLLYPTICLKGFQRYNRNTITNNKLKISLQLILSSGYILLRIKSQSTKFKGDWINYFLCVVMLSILYTVRIISFCFYMILGFAFFHPLYFGIWLRVQPHENGQRCLISHLCIHNRQAFSPGSGLPFLEVCFLFWQKKKKKKKNTYLFIHKCSIPPSFLYKHYHAVHSFILCYFHLIYPGNSSISITEFFSHSFLQLQSISVDMLKSIQPMFLYMYV